MSSRKEIEKTSGRADIPSGEKRRFLILLALLAVAAGLSCSDEVIEVGPANISVESLFAINDNGLVTLGWSPWIGSAPDEIEVHRSTSPQFTISVETYHATLDGRADRFEDSAVTNGSVYHYRILPIERSPGGFRSIGPPSNSVPGRPYDYGTVIDIGYGADIQPIFSSSCAVHGCHVGYTDTTPDDELNFPKTTHGGQFSLQSWEDLFSGSTDGAVAIPYFSRKSDLANHVNPDTLDGPVALPHMPLPGFNLPPSQISTLRRWIDEGAKNDAGVVPYSTNPMGKMLAVCASEDLIAVIDVQSNLLIRYIDVTASDLSFGAPHHVKVDPQGEFFYVTLIGAQQLQKYSTSTYELVESVAIPFQPADLLLSASGDSAYVTCFGSTQGLVTVVDTRTMSIIRSIYTSFAINPHGILMSKDKTRIFVGNAGSGNLTVIDAAFSTSLISMDTLGNPFESDVSPYLLDVTPDDRYLFVTDYAPGGENVYVIDLLLDPTKPTHVIPIGGRSVHVAITPDGQSAFVCNLTTNSVNVISTSDFSVRTIPDVGKQPHGIIFTPDGKKAYVTTENIFDPDPPHHPSSGSTGLSFVTLIDVETLQILAKIEVGGFGQGIAYSP